MNVSQPTRTLTVMATCDFDGCDRLAVSVHGTGYGGGRAWRSCDDLEHLRWARECVRIAVERHEHAASGLA